ncbi:hypothetical protein ACKVWC_001350, partial [Pyricularia oryzae]
MDKVWSASDHDLSNLALLFVFLSLGSITIISVVLLPRVPSWQTSASFRRAVRSAGVGHHVPADVALDAEVWASGLSVWWACDCSQMLGLLEEDAQDSEAG